MNLDLGVDESGVISWYIDTEFSVENDMKIHTGFMMTLGQGVAIDISTLQKLNTKISSESEPVDADDVVPYAIWYR